jgi:uncharacterized protein involved in exopolysaccharide biosynthesis
MHPADPSPVDPTSKHMPEPVPAAAGGQRQPSPHQGLILSARGDAADNGLPAPLPLIPSLQSLLKAYKQCWVTATLIGLLLGGGLGAGMWFLKPPQYTAVAVLRVGPEPRLLPGERATATLGGETYKQTQAALVKSRPVLKLALQTPLPGEEGGTVGNSLKMISLEPDQFVWLEENLKVGFAEGTDLMRISLSGDAPQELAILVNAVKEAYLQEVANAEQIDRERKLDELNKACKKLETNLETQQKMLRQWAEALKANDPRVIQQMQQIALTEYAAARSELARLQVLLGDAELDLKVRQAPFQDAQGIDVPDYLINPVLDKEPAVVKLAEKVLHIETLVKDTETALAPGATNNRLRQYKEDLKSARAALDRKKEELRGEVAGRERKRIQGEGNARLAQARTKLDVLREQLKKVGNYVAEQRKRVETIGDNALGLEVKRGEIEQAETMIKELRQVRGRLQVELEGNSRRITEVQEAEVPKTKNIRSQIVRTAATGLWGFLLGIVGVAYREFRTGRITGRDDLSASLRLQVFGSLPALSGTVARRGLGGRGQDVSFLFRECMDGVRTTLLHNEATQACRVVMVTSPGSQEGKTTLSAHLSASLARAHRKTLLIDCDTRRACIQRLFDIPRQPGLSQVLNGELDMAEAVRPGSIDGLFVLTAGPFDPEGMNAGSRRSFEKSVGNN